MAAQGTAPTVRVSSCDGHARPLAHTEPYTHARPLAHTRVSQWARVNACVAHLALVQCPVRAHTAVQRSGGLSHSGVGAHTPTHVHLAHVQCLGHTRVHNTLCTHTHQCMQCLDGVCTH